MKERIKILRDYLKLSQEELAKELGLKQGSYSDIERGKNALSGPVMELLRVKFGVNQVWIETGEGAMITSQPYSQAINKQIAKPSGIIETLQEEIEILQMQVKMLEKQNADHDDFISQLSEAAGVKLKIKKAG